MTVRLPTIPLLVLTSALRCAAQPAPQQPPVFRAETAGVVVDVIVTDRKGAHVPGLSAADFKLYEDNAPQTIVSFVAPEVHNAPRGPQSGTTRSPQLITLVIDTGDLHADSLKRTCAAASAFAARTIAAGNSVAIYWVDTSLHLGLPFSQDKQRVLDVLEKLGRRAPISRFGARERERTENEIDDLFAAVYPETLLGMPPTAKNIGPGQGGAPQRRQTPEQQRDAEIQREKFQEMNMLRSWLTIAGAMQARTVFVALRAIAVAYRDLPGRKSVVVFSEGFLHSPETTFEMQAVIDAANRANVAIYVIDASGVTTGTSAEMRAPAIGRKRASQDFSMLGADARASGLNQFDWIQTLGSDLHGDLGLVASGTGGFLVKDTNDLAPALDRVVEDGGGSYTLVYHPGNHDYNGAFRKIKVELAERGFRLRYRQGYWAIPPGREVMMTPAGAQLLAAVESGERKPSFTPRVNAAVVPAPGGGFGVPVAVSMPGKLVPFEKLKDQYVAGVSVLLIARNAKGELLAVQERYGDVRLKRSEREAFSAKVFTMQGHVPVPDLQPVNVQAVVRFATGTVGVSERIDIDPPQSLPLRLTSLVLSDRVEEAECSAHPMDPLCMKGRRILLPAESQFARSARLIVYFSVLGVSRNGAQEPNLDISFQVGAPGAMKSLTPALLRAAPGIRPDAFLVTAAFDLQSLEPGAYTLEMSAEDGVQKARVAAKAQFTVQ